MRFESFDVRSFSASNELIRKSHSIEKKRFFLFLALFTQIIIIIMANYSNSLTVCIDCTKSNQSDLVEQLLSSTSSSNIIPSVEFSDQINVYPLRLETKYYTVDLGLCKIIKPTVGSAEFADRVEAVIFHLDSTGDPLPSVESWMSFVKHWEPSVQILIFDRLSTDKRQEILVWCAKNEFELIELDPDDDTLQEAEDCGEIVGIRRVVQVLKVNLIVGSK